MIESSRNVKMTIYDHSQGSDNSLEPNVAVLLMIGKVVIKATLLSSNSDATSEEGLQDVIQTELSDEMFTKDTIYSGVHTEASNIQSLAEDIRDVLLEYKECIVEVFGQDDEQEQYVIFNSSISAHHGNFDTIEKVIEEADITIMPTHLGLLFPGADDIRPILEKYGGADMLVSESPLSEASYLGVVLDLSLGYKY